MIRGAEYGPHRQYHMIKSKEAGSHMTRLFTLTSDKLSASLTKESIREGLT